MLCKESNRREPCARQVPCPLYLCNLCFNFFSLIPIDWCFYSDWGSLHFVFGAQRSCHLFSCDFAQCDYSACIGLYVVCERAHAVICSQDFQKNATGIMLSMWVMAKTKLKFSYLFGRHQLSHSELPKVKWFFYHYSWKPF